MDIFAWGAASWNIPSTTPFYGWTFGFLTGCGSALTLPSGESIWQFYWLKQGVFDEYLVLSDEWDCTGTPWTGNKGRNYSLISDADNGYFWYWNNGGGGTGMEWATCLFVCDAVMIPVNAPGKPGNPFYAYGFDVGVATLMPYLSSNACSLGFMTQAYDAPAGAASACVPLACFSFSPPIVYGPHNYRICGWDMITNLFAGMAPIFAHNLMPGYPACMYGSTVGGNSIILPFPADTALMCVEWEFFGYLTGGQPPTANYRVTFF